VRLARNAQRSEEAELLQERAWESSSEAGRAGPGWVKCELSSDLAHRPNGGDKVSNFGELLIIARIVRTDTGI
jgi:hypothetical protein